MEIRKLNKSVVYAVGVTLTIIFILFGIKYINNWREESKNASMRPPPEAVNSIVTSEAEWPETIQSVGSIIASNGVTMSAEEPGRVSKINFESGSIVQAGTVLVELDSSVEEG